jgi:phenylacetate-CoA ligase
LTPLLQTLYDLLPYPARSLAASLRGQELQRWRYGPETDDQVAEAVERESWDCERWKGFQGERLGALLAHAAANVPFYRRQWSERRQRGDRSPVECLENWPILTKDQLRERPEAFLADGTDVRRLYEDHTSGTSGKPLRLWQSRETSRSWYALFEARVRRWNGVTRSDRWAMLGGQLVVPIRQRRPPFWVWNAGMQQLYMSSYHLSPATIPAYLDAMRRHQVKYVLGYASSMATIAQLSLELGVPAPTLHVAISNAEPLLDSQRARISRAFGCTVRDTYGMAEIVAAGSECAEGRLHIWPEVGVTEILRDDANAGSAVADPGRLVSTGLLNFDMPLVRYEIGDRGKLVSSQVTCDCRRLLPCIEAIEGRSDDLIITPEGRRIGRLDPVFKGDLPIREAQIVQEALDQVRVRVIPGPGFGGSHVRLLRRLLHERLGESIQVTIESVGEIARGPGGKFKAVISRIAPPPSSLG